MKPTNLKPMDRRTFLKASGVALALPMLDVMGTARAAPAGPRRLVNICCTLGLFADSWQPKTAGAGYETTEYLKLLDHKRSRYTVFSGLSHKEQTGRQAHNSEITWLTAAKHPGLDGFQNTTSLDQAVADHLGYVTRFPSIVLGTATPQSQSYTRNGVMVPAQTSPARMFKQLFLAGTPEEIEKETQRLSDGGSVLDHLKAQTAALERRASQGDKVKLQAYYEAVRTAEKNLAEVQAWMERPKPTVAAAPPVDLPETAELVGRVGLLFDLIPLIIATDSSRVISVMIQDHGVVPKVNGVSADQHSLSHHGQDESKIAQLKLVETELVRKFATLLEQMDQSQEGDLKLLDHTAVLFGSNLGNANSHVATNLPILVAGGGFAHGQHVAHDLKQNAPLCNLFVTLLQYMGLEADQFGQSTGALTWS